MNTDERQIRELVETWMTASKAGDLGAVLDLMTDDVIFMTPGRAPFGKGEFAANGERMKDFTMEGHHTLIRLRRTVRVIKRWDASTRQGCLDRMHI